MSDESQVIPGVLPRKPAALALPDWVGNLPGAWPNGHGKIGEPGLKFYERRF